ncbi:guanylate kinase-like [Tigriopus californicus]|uniref:guanylate kinase-like n=1 Tax=Tigriopus californicus TaxID=6832 RepID=UPI0027D9F73A|nr:guanylate kinase-like [Tigriopus californicus]
MPISFTRCLFYIPVGKGCLRRISFPPKVWERVYLDGWRASNSFPIRWRSKKVRGSFLNVMSLSSCYPLVLCGPSGSGKSTLMNKLMGEFPEKFGFSVSHTTRKPRPGEVDGVHYHFSNRPFMEAMIDNGEFLESAEFSGNLYGTSKAAVRKVLQNGKICILDIEIQGVQSVKKSDLHAKYVFIKPPSIEILEQRLRDRGTELEDALQKRLDTAAKEMEYGETPGHFDRMIVNHKVDEAYLDLKSFLGL